MIMVKVVEERKGLHDKLSNVFANEKKNIVIEQRYVLRSHRKFIKNGNKNYFAKFVYETTIETSD